MGQILSLDVLGEKRQKGLLFFSAFKVVVTSLHQLFGICHLKKFI